MTRNARVSWWVTGLSSLIIVFNEDKEGVLLAPWRFRTWAFIINGHEHKRSLGIYGGCDTWFAIQVTRRSAQYRFPWRRFVRYFFSHTVASFCFPRLILQPSAVCHIIFPEVGGCTYIPTAWMTRKLRQIGDCVTTERDVLTFHFTLHTKTVLRLDSDWTENG